MRIGYARVSTARQSVDRQIDELMAAGCERVFSEVASGKRGAHRPQWDACLATLRAGDTLVVTELSRLGRNTAAVTLLAEELETRQIALSIQNLGLDTTTPAGRLIFTVIAAVAAMERELLVERTISGLEAARSRGHRGGRKPVLSAADVRKARRLVNHGATMADAAATMGVSRPTLYRYLGSVDRRTSDSVDMTPEPVDRDRITALAAEVDADTASC